MIKHAYHSKQDKMNQKMPVTIIIRKTFFVLAVILFWLLVFQYFAYFRTFKAPQLPPQPPQFDLCPITPPNLWGEFTPDIATVTLDAIESRFGDVLQPGGYYKPEQCIARDRVAVIVACRDRDHQIPILLNNIHPLMMRQQIEYQVFIVLQTHGYWFNRAALFNVGYVEALKVKRWDCVIFHDVDMVPMNDRNLYNCPRTNPRHMGVAVDKFGFKLHAEAMVGGVMAATVEQYEAANGHSNAFWGWGGEDNDMYYRFLDAGYTVERYPLHLTKYMSMQHEPSFQNREWEQEVKRGKTRMSIDGLNTLKYHVLELEKKTTFTRILVDIIPSEMGRNSNEVIEPNFKSSK